ncbi:MAG: hypothetical protein FJ088_00260 [Deltaproteobacteria bacterium]|nr:hypothetical protein [Deltaproteobacteria bacterium]
MKTAWIVNIAAAILFLILSLLTVKDMVTSAGERLEKGVADTGDAVKKNPQIASLSEVEYCNEHLKTVLRRVLENCGLIGAGSRRGCQPDDVKKITMISDDDFNTLFKPLSKRAAIVLFDKGKSDLTEEAAKLIEENWTDQKGASFFFVVARASTDGPTELNRVLSHKRANSALFHLHEKFKDPDLEQKVGLLWLGEEFAQLPEEFCAWNNSRKGQPCTVEDINRSVVISWIDCRI